MYFLSPNKKIFDRPLIADILIFGYYWSKTQSMVDFETNLNRYMTTETEITTENLYYIEIIISIHQMKIRKI